jgi:hypothetical protein
MEAGFKIQGCNKPWRGAHVDTKNRKIDAKAWSYANKKWRGETILILNGKARLSDQHARCIKLNTLEGLLSLIFSQKYDIT